VKIESASCPQNSCLASGSGANQKVCNRFIVAHFTEDRFRWRDRMNRLQTFWFAQIRRQGGRFWRQEARLRSSTNLLEIRFGGGRNFAQEWVNPTCRFIASSNSGWSLTSIPCHADTHTNVFIGTDYLRSEYRCLGSPIWPLPCCWCRNNETTAPLWRDVKQSAHGCSRISGRTHAGAPIPNLPVCIRGMSPAQLVDYLHALDWQGSGSDRLVYSPHLTGKSNG